MGPPGRDKPYRLPRLGRLALATLALALATAGSLLSAGPARAAKATGPSASSSTTPISPGTVDACLRSPAVGGSRIPQLPCPGRASMPTGPGASQRPSASGNLGAAGQWAIVPSPNALEPKDALSGVTCVSALDCWAVGRSSNGSAEQTLIERWDGKAWVVVPSADTSAAENNSLVGVTCVSASDCWAVGGASFNSADQTIVERWNGASWALVPSPNPVPPPGFTAHSTVLDAVTCVSASDCWAVGLYVNLTSAIPPSGEAQTLAERWDGTSWALITSANTSPTENNDLFGVACASASDCWAVGASCCASGGEQVLAERWDGASWGIVPSAIPLASQGSLFFGVTCVTASDCWAVGENSSQVGGGQTLTERWNGTAWAVVTSADTSATQSNDALQGVTCVSASDCWAVGYSLVSAATGGVVFQTLIESWNGISWAIVPSPDTSAQNNSLFGVACVSASDCWAVGDSSNGSADQTLTERGDGTSWAIISSANTVGPTPSILLGVTCVSASDCWAVGYSFNGANYQTLTERWDGTTWAIVASANASTTQNNVLNAVTCVSASDCWAVGYAVSFSQALGYVYQTLVERWDGTSWAIVTSANTVGPLTNILYGVTCVSASDCWAVGYASNGSSLQTLTERWNGTSWAIVTSADTLPARDNVLYGVTCVSASDCWAAGYASNGSVSQTLTELWNGIAWAVVTSADTSATQNDVLESVTCVSASDCWAAGYYHNGLNYQSLAERWNGISWAIVTSANTSPTQDNVLLGVTCVSASDCWAVGESYNGIAVQTVIELWDGNSWAMVISANTSAKKTNILSGVSCVSASDCWAVGDSTATGQAQTLTEEFRASPSPQIPEVPWLPLLPVAGATALATRVLVSGRRRLPPGGIEPPSTG